MHSSSFALLILTICLPYFNLTAYIRDKNYQYQLAAAMVFQNEASHLKEWIEYHKLVGFEHFYLFNNNSTDNYSEILKPYVSKGEVELYDYPQVSTTLAEHIGIQCAAYTHALSLARGHVKWLAIMDGDEFITPLNQYSVLDVLKDYDHAGGVYLNWLSFGTSHVEKIPEDKLMIETLTFCAEYPSSMGKSIVRPERVSGCTDPHRLWYHSPYYHMNTKGESFDWICPIADDKMLVFHYYTGDLDHLTHVKFPRRQKWIGIELDSYIQSLEFLNAVYNPTMLRYVPALRRKMHKK